MKLTDDLKKKLEAAQTKEEAEAILAETKDGVEWAGIELDTKELETVAGGGSDAPYGAEEAAADQCHEKTEDIKRGG